MRELNPRQQRFVREYLVDLNGTQAAIRAGYKESSARQQASENLSKPYIAAAIDDAMAKDPGVTRTRIVDELAKIGFSNIQDYMGLTHDGDAHFDLSSLEAGQAAAIQEITVDTYREGRGGNAGDVKRVKIKLHDKLSALEKLGRALAMFTDRIEHMGKNALPVVPVINVTVDAEPEHASKTRKAAYHVGNGNPPITSQNQPAIPKSLWD
jgi:phage terminase small subunit